MCLSSLPTYMMEEGGSKQYIYRHEQLNVSLRILVQSGIYDEYLSALSKAVSQLKLGDPLQEGVEQGPLVNEAALAKVGRCYHIPQVLYPDVWHDTIFRSKGICQMP